MARKQIVTSGISNAAITAAKLNANAFASPTFTGTAAAVTGTVDTSSTQIATQAFVLGQAGAATPLIDGTAAVGTSTRYSRQDHVHASDTTRAPLASPTFSGTVGIGNTAANVSLYNAKTVTGGANAYGYLHQGYLETTVTNGAVLMEVQLNTVANCSLVSVIHYNCVVGTIGAGLVLSHQYGYNVGALDQATNNIGFNSNMNNSGTGKTNWAIYCSGTARSVHMGKFGIGGAPTTTGATLQVTGDTIQLTTARTPASASATGNVGEICWDASYLYVCTATNTWKRSLISTW